MNRLLAILTALAVAALPAFSQTQNITATPTGPTNGTLKWPSDTLLINNTVIFQGNLAGGLGIGNPITMTPGFIGWHVGGIQIDDGFTFTIDAAAAEDFRAALGANASGVWTGNTGGTGFASYTVGDLLYANSVNSLAKLAGVATGNVLRSGGVGTAPAWGKVTSSHVDGTIATVLPGEENHNISTMTGLQVINNDVNDELIIGDTLILNGPSLVLDAAMVFDSDTYEGQSGWSLTSTGFGTKWLPNSLTTTIAAAGTAATIGEDPEQLLDFGTTDPVIQLGAIGKYHVTACVTIEYDGATIGGETVTLAIWDASNGAAVGTSVPYVIEAATTATRTIAVVCWDAVYEANAGLEFIRINGQITNVPSAGNITASRATITAVYAGPIGSNP